MKRINVSLQKALLSTGVIVFAGLLFAACNKKLDSGNTDTSSAAMTTLNLAPDKAGVVLALSGNLLPGGVLGYPSSYGYFNIVPGSRQLTATDYSSGATLGSPVTMTYDTSKYYSAFFMGANNTYSTVVVEDNFDSLSAASGKAYVRYVNAIPDSVKPAVTIGSALSVSAPYGSVSDFVAVDPGNLAISVQGNDAFQTSRNITVSAANVYTLLLVGLPSATDTAQKVQIRYINNGQLSDEQKAKTSQRTMD